jgi:hypothetical protein
MCIAADEHADMLQGDADLENRGQSGFITGQIL